MYIHTYSGWGEKCSFKTYHSIMIHGVQQQLPVLGGNDLRIETNFQHGTRQKWVRLHPAVDQPAEEPGPGSQDSSMAHQLRWDLVRVVEGESTVSHAAGLPQVGDVRLEAVGSSEFLLKQRDGWQVARIARIRCRWQWRHLRQDFRAPAVQVLQGTFQGRLKETELVILIVGAQLFDFPQSRLKVETGDCHESRLNT